ncbi:hypothetical protein [Aquibacillus salsiterrae]|uniref:Uncharacterized protein n=1 Tax=Aquibacillus salsiterrae TaxID=2950439 RepID=A0A9X4AFP6_9BACI|nr:hypothetical protein [Aquibacillus salsiterrae]MDC3418237.1 hypothetical protein [Aquibacillus salsiterrae]
MNYNGASDLLDLVSGYFEDKTLFLSQINDGTLTVIKTLEGQNSMINLAEGQKLQIEDSY